MASSFLTPEQRFEELATLLAAGARRLSRLKDAVPFDLLEFGLTVALHLAVSCSSQNRPNFSYWPKPIQPILRETATISIHQRSF